jgi:hypothetical protein
MKKLLLVMLVPVMVLGIMGCGKSLETGDEVPYILHGTWVDDGTGDNSANAGLFNNNPAFVLTANEMTVYLPQAGALTTPAGFTGGGYLQLAFAAEFIGPKDNFLDDADDDGNVEFSVKITRILDGVEWGTFKFQYNVTRDQITCIETIKIETSVVPYYEFNNLLPEEAVYDRAIVKRS